MFRVHQAYIQAGAQIIETNTFGANRSKLAALGLADQVTKINHRGVKIAREAREAAPHEVLIAGSIGPLAIAPEMRETPREEMLEIYREQAQALEERGVDLFVLETFSNMEMMLAAIDAVRSFSALPIVAQLTFSEEGTTLGGTRPADAAARLAQKNVQVIGVNCTLGPQSLLSVLEGFAGGNRALSAMPNVGFPQRVGDRTIYPRSSPEYFALFARDAAALGARVVGGCCGTTPEHVRAIAGAVRGLNRRIGESRFCDRCRVTWRRRDRFSEIPRAAYGASSRRANFAFRWRSIRPRAFRSSASSSKWTRSSRAAAWIPLTSIAARWPAWAWMR